MALIRWVQADPSGTAAFAQPGRRHAADPSHRMRDLMVGMTLAVSSLVVTAALSAEGVLPGQGAFGGVLDRVPGFVESLIPGGDDGDRPTSTTDVGLRASFTDLFPAADGAPVSMVPAGSPDLVGWLSGSSGPSGVGSITVPGPGTPGGSGPGAPGSPGGGSGTSGPVTAPGGSGSTGGTDSGSATSGVIGAITPAPVANAVQPVVAPLSPVLDPAAKAAGPVVQSAAPVAAPVVNAAEPVVAPLAPVLQPVTSAAAPVAQPLAPVTNTVGGLVGGLG